MDASPEKVDAQRHHAAQLTARSKAFAERLESALENFRPPRDLPIPQRALDIFRDEGDFTGIDYFRAIEAHLAQSRKLIVVCSPAARASQYVNDEIERFVRIHSADNLVPVIVDGLANNEAKSPEDPRCAFPPALTKALALPLAADWRSFNSKRDRIDRGAFASAWFKLLADLYGQSRAAIEQRELRRQTRNRRITVCVASVIIAALSIALVMSLFYRAQAVNERDNARQAAQNERVAREAESRALAEQARARTEAEASRDEALRQKAIAESEAVAARRETAERLAVQAIEKLDGAPGQALALASDAVRAFRDHGDPLVPNALAALLQATLAFGGGLPAFPQADSRSRLVFADHLRWAAQVDPHGEVRAGPVGSTNPPRLAPPPLPPGWHWSDDKIQLAFGPRQLVALRSAKAPGEDVERGQLFTWALNEAGRAAVPIDSVKPEHFAEWSRLIVSPDGRWSAWSDARDRAYVRSLDPSAKAVKARCDWVQDCRLAFSSDSRWLVVVDGSSGIRRFALPQAGTVPEERPPLAWPGGSTAQIALVVGERRLAGDPVWRYAVRLAWLGRNAEVVWWDLTEPEPVAHRLPGLLEPFSSKVRLTSLAPEIARTALSWHPRGNGLLVTAVNPDADFGFAALNLVDDDAAWKPLWHRYDGKALSTTSRSSSGSGYSVKDTADLGVQAAVWTSVDGVFTLGFDGTVWFRDLAHLAENRFQLIERQASAILQSGVFVIVGGRDGRLRFWNMRRESNGPWLTLNGFDAPVRDIQWSGLTLMATDARGVARVWNVGHPLPAGWLNSDRRSDVDGHNARWLVTSGRAGAGIQLWSLTARGSDPIVLPTTGASDAVNAVDPAARWALSLRPDPADPRGWVLKRWNLDDDAPQRMAPVEHRFRWVSTHRDGSVWLHAPTRGAARRVMLGVGFGADSGLYMLELGAVGTTPRRIGAIDEGWELGGGTSDDLRWVVVKTALKAGSRQRYGIADLESMQRGVGSLPVLPLPDGYAGRLASFSDDSAWLTLEIEDYDKCVLRLVRPLPTCVKVPREPRGDRAEVLYVPGQGPLAWHRGGRALAFVAGRFVAAHLPKGLAAVGWNAQGSWRAIAGDRIGVLVRQEGSEVDEKLPDPSIATKQLYRLFPFVDRGWLFASDTGGTLVAWHRDTKLGWQRPFTLDRDALRQSWGPLSVELSADGRTLDVDGQRIVLDPDLLVDEAQALVSGRLGK